MRAAIGPGPFPDAWWQHVDAGRLERIGQVIADLDADVVALQEVALLALDGATLDNTADLARQTGYEARFGATRHFPIIDADGEVRGAGLFGNAILSRLPIESARTVALPAAAIDALVEPEGVDHPAAGVRYAEAPTTIREPRCLLVAEVRLSDGRTLSVGSAHLSHIGSGERRLQAELLWETFDGIGLGILGGDLNAPMSAAELEPLVETFTDAFTATGVPVGDPRRASCETHQIDQILVRGLEPTACRVVTEAAEASDHWAVVATLTL